MLMNLFKALIKESALTECKNSMRTVRIVKHVKRQPYLLTYDRPGFISIGPKQSIPTNVNGGSLGVARSFGRSAVNCPAGSPSFSDNQNICSALGALQISLSRSNTYVSRMTKLTLDTCVPLSGDRL